MRVVMRRRKALKLNSGASEVAAGLVIVCLPAELRRLGVAEDVVRGRHAYPLIGAVPVLVPAWLSLLLAAPERLYITSARHCSDGMWMATVSPSPTDTDGWKRRRMRVVPPASSS